MTTTKQAREALIERLNNHVHSASPLARGWAREAAYLLDRAATTLRQHDEAGAVRVRELPWAKNSPRVENSLWAMVEELNRYYTIEPVSNVFEVETRLMLSEYGPGKMGLHPTLDAAKAAAQADYTSRILSALEAPEPAAPGAVEPVGHMELGELADLMAGGSGIAVKLREDDVAKVADKYVAIYTTPPVPDARFQFGERIPTRGDEK